MRIKKFLIAGGNSTALIWDCPITEREKVAKRLLEEVEQVGFIYNNNLNMMGGELCINATIAFASQLSSEGKLFTSGVKNSINFININDRTTIKVPLKFWKNDNVVLFDGIGFILFNKDENKEITKEILSNYAEKYKLDAFGAIVYEENKITPYVYVRGVDSFVKETACGSGSTALAILKGFSDIVQPTGEIISIKIIDDLIEITAEVREIK